MLTRAAAFASRHAIALIALFVALGSGSAVAATYINGAQIKPNSIPENRLTISALKDLRGPSAYSDNAGVTPPAGGTQSVIKQVQITTTQTGKILILNALLEGASFNNTSNAPVNYSVGIYVDGIPVPGTYVGGYVAPPMTAGSFPASDSLYGSLSNVPAGTHTVTIAARTTNTSVNYITGGSGRLLVLATS